MGCCDYIIFIFYGKYIFVKTMIREKKNPTYRLVSWGYHSLLVIATLIVSPWFTIAFIPSLIRSILLYGRNISILKVGILEYKFYLLFCFSNNVS